ncbi:MAG: hypothetical protein HKO64_03710 [Xanthomonadales bacterium]|nr:hypothetical protein [Gammaproteobacteria bacterium]NNL94705.1 hypothetical protein [Xanthomonadales bacterium]
MPGKMQQARRQIAAEAARIMATQGQRNYRLAKQKAAARIGVQSRLALPSNKEVEQALLEYLDLYGGEARGHQLNQLRRTAMKVMRALDTFQPRLVGPVLEGTADRYSRISIHLFNDPPDEVARHLSDRGLDFSYEERTIRWHDNSQHRLPLLVTEADGVVVELALFSSIDLRQAPPSPVDGRPQRRAAITEIEGLLAGA